MQEGGGGRRRFTHALAAGVLASQAELRALAESAAAFAEHIVTGSSQRPRPVGLDRSF